jgi:phosphoribosylformylglycinamidine synthase subunit PurS
VRFEVVVEVQLLPGIADPQGATIERALPALGFSEIHGLRVGKAIRFEVDADDERAAMKSAEDVASKLLANPVMEQADVHVSPVGAHSEPTAGAGIAR